MNWRACEGKHEPQRANSTLAPLNLSVGRDGVQHLLFEIHQPHD
jgi:hypothetical protein